MSAFAQSKIAPPAEIDLSFRGCDIESMISDTDALKAFVSANHDNYRVLDLRPIEAAKLVSNSDKASSNLELPVSVKAELPLSPRYFKLNKNLLTKPLVIIANPLDLPRLEHSLCKLKRTNPSLKFTVPRQGIISWSHAGLPLLGETKQLPLEYLVSIEDFDPYARQSCSAVYDLSSKILAKLEDSYAGYTLLNEQRLQNLELDQLTAPDSVSFIILRHYNITQAFALAARIDRQKIPDLYIVAASSKEIEKHLELKDKINQSRHRSPAEKLQCHRKSY